jgi:hypothetical protein
MDLISVMFRWLEREQSSGGREVGEVCRAGNVVVVFVCLNIYVYIERRSVESGRNPKSGPT